jgi:hypothetical protein
VAGEGFQSLEDAPRLVGLRHRRFGDDLLVEACIEQGEVTPARRS